MLQEERQKIIMEMRAREQNAKERLNSAVEERKARLKRKLDEAESRKEEHLKEIVEKAKVESEKKDENAFVLKLSKQSKEIEINK